MKRFLGSFAKVLLVSAILAVPLSSTVLADGTTIDMVVSPNVLNMESNGGSVSIHTDIGYVAEADATLVVNGTPTEIVNTFPDNRGNLVVKCDIDTVKAIVAGAEDAVFVLTYAHGGGTYSGTDTIAVIQVVPQKT